MFKRGVLFLVLVLVLCNSISALGVSPAKVEMNFEPNLEKSFDYRAFGGNPNSELEIYAIGDLAEYITFDKATLPGGGGTFNAYLTLPEKLENPGKNVAFVGVREKIDPELVSGNIGTAVAIQVAVVVYVPYPGRYLDIDLRSEDVNVGEPVDFELDLDSKGKENVNVSPVISIYSEDNFIENLYFSNRIVNSQEKISLKKSLDTSDYNPGAYRAVAVVDYGVLAKDEENFRIGELKIDLLNTTKQIQVGGVRKFELEVQSGWNDVIDGAYADVSFFRGIDNLGNFRTTTTTLTPWEKKKIEGYFDSSNFSVGVYDANVTLNYFGKNTGKSSSEIVRVEFIEKKVDIKLWYYLVGGAIIFGAVIIFVLKFLKRKKHGKKKK